MGDAVDERRGEGVLVFESDRDEGLGDGGVELLGGVDGKEVRKKTGNMRGGHGGAREGRNSGRAALVGGQNVKT